MHGFYFWPELNSYRVVGYLMIDLLIDWIINWLIHISGIDCIYNYLESFFHKKMMGPILFQDWKWLSLQNLSIVIFKNLVFNKVRNLWILGRSQIMTVATEFRFRAWIWVPWLVFISWALHVVLSEIDIT
jgi:hypothetical protein